MAMAFSNPITVEIEREKIDQTIEGFEWETLGAHPKES